MRYEKRYRGDREGVEVIREDVIRDDVNIDDDTK